MCIKSSSSNQAYMPRVMFIVWPLDDMINPRLEYFLNDMLTVLILMLMINS